MMLHVCLPLFQVSFPSNPHKKITRSECSDLDFLPYRKLRFRINQKDFVLFALLPENAALVFTR